MDHRQLSTALAALRFWQREGLTGAGGEHDVATDGGTIEPLSAHEIDELCEAINNPSVDAVARAAVDQVLGSARVFVRDARATLQSVAGKVSAVEALVLLPLIASVAVVDQHIGALIAARNDRPPIE